jgi:hypothetical protein
MTTKDTEESRQESLTRAKGPDYSGRHPATQHLIRTLKPNPRLDGIAADVAQGIWEVAQFMCKILNDGQELSAGLRLLRQAKDCLVLQALEDCEKL